MRYDTGIKTLRVTWALLIALILVIVFFGCNPERKLARLLMKYPELRDTVFITDTVEALVEYVHHDTTFVPVPGDTVTIQKDRLRVKYVRMAGDTVWVGGECLPDTIRVPVAYEVPVIQPIRTVKDVPWQFWLLVAALVLALLLTLVSKLFSNR